MKQSKMIFKLLLSSMLLLSISWFGCGGGSDSGDDGYVQWRTFSTGYNAAKADTAAFIYYRMPEQYKYALTIGGYWNPENGRFVDPPADSPGIDGITATVFASYTPETFLHTNNAMVTAYSLDQFLTAANFLNATPKPTAFPAGGDARSLYAYVIFAASDGFTWRSRSDDILDLIWDGQMDSTYLGALNNNARILYKPTYGTLGHPAYGNVGSVPSGSNLRNVSYAEHVFAFRKIDVQIGSALQETHKNLIIFETGATEERSYKGRATRPNKFITESTVTIGGTSETVVKVSDNFLIPRVTGAYSSSPTSYTIVDVTGATTTYSTTEIADAYFVPAKEFISLADGTKKVNYPVRIIIEGVTYTAQTGNVPSMSASFQ